MSESKNIPVLNEKLERDPDSKAIISTDFEGYKAFKKRRRKIKDHEQRLSTLEDKMDRILELLEK